MTHETTPADVDLSSDPREFNPGDEEGHAAAWGGGGLVTIVVIVLLLILIF